MSNIFDLKKKILDFEKKIEVLEKTVEGIYKSVHGIEPDEPDKIKMAIDELKENQENINKILKIITEGRILELIYHEKLEEVLRDLNDKLHNKGIINIGEYITNKTKLDSQEKSDKKKFPEMYEALNKLAGKTEKKIKKGEVKK